MWLGAALVTSSSRQQVTFSSGALCARLVYIIARQLYNQVVIPVRAHWPLIINYNVITRSVAPNLTIVNHTYFELPERWHPFFAALLISL